MTKNIILAVLVAAVVLLLIFRIQVQVSNTQNQAQTTKVDTWNVNNNQNININSMAFDKKLVYTNREYKGLPAADQIIRALSVFQQMHCFAVPCEDGGRLYYPVLAGTGTVSRVSTTNTSTNFSFHKLGLWFGSK